MVNVMAGAGFTVLRWTVPDDVKQLVPTGVKVLKFDKRDVIIIWFKNDILVFDNIVVSALSERDISSGNPIVLSVESSIVDILQLGEVVGVFTGRSLYLIKTDKSILRSTSCPGFGAGYKTTLDLKIHMKMHQEVLALSALTLGFVLLKRKSNNLYVDIYKTGPKMIPIEKRFSVQLPQFPCEDGSCTLSSVQHSELDPGLASLLLEDLALTSSGIIFVGVGYGRVYCIPVLIESTSTSPPIPKILYNTTQPIAEIVCLRDPITSLYAHVGIILCSGPVVYISCDQQKLRYQMMYLPGSVKDCCPVRDGIVAADGVDLWHSKLSWSKEGQPVVENRMLGVKGVCIVCPIPGVDAILAVTIHLTLYSVQLGTKTLCQPKNFIIPPNIMANMDSQMKYLAKLKTQMAKEEKALEAISIGMRNELLKDTFTMTIWVHNADIDSSSEQYIFEINLKNTADQDYSPEIWSLHISIRTKGTQIMETSKLTQRIRKCTCLQRCVRASIPELISQIDVSCSLVARISEETSTESAAWVVIPIAMTTLDISYFFSPSIHPKRNTLSEDLLKIAHSHMGDDMKRLEFEHSPLSSECTYTCRLRCEFSSPSEVWNAVVKNCRHRFTEVTTGRELNLYVGCRLVKMVLNEDCSAMQLKSENTELLHCTKCSIGFLLEADSPRKRVVINRSILSQAEKLKADVQLEGADIQSLKLEWRDLVARHLPL